MLIGAIDAGGTKVLTAVMKESGEVVSRQQNSVTTSNIPDYFKRCADMLTTCANEAGCNVGNLGGIGMNIPGMVTPDGCVLGSPSAGWDTFEARPLLMRALGIDHGNIFFENDINACALAELHFGGADGDFIWLTISTGNGGAVVANGNLLRGAQGCAGEIGHIKVERHSAYPCGCGGSGCLEAHASGVAIARRAAEAGLARDTDARRCEELAREGNAIALAVYAETGIYIGRALASAANLVNPEYAFIGGGVSAALDLMLPAIEDTLKNEAVPQCADLKVVRTRLGYDAALLGAAAVCLGGMDIPVRL